METSTSTTARPWFICPTWAAVAPLLVDAIARRGEHLDAAGAAEAEILRLADGLDRWNRAVPAALADLDAALRLYEEGDAIAASRRISRAAATLRGR